MFHRKVWRSDAAHTPRATLRVEELEARVVPYATTGNAWPQPQLITISFVPDGTLIGYNQNGPIYSTLFADFNAKFGSTAAWEKQILLAANSWGEATNINFSVVGDNGVDIGTVDGYNEQGDPNIGDIRIAGFQDVGAGYLAQAYQPPPANDYSIAGDLWFNTSQNFHIGSTYDLFTVAAHEIGHALGMDHSANTSAIMAPVYPGTHTGLTLDDKQGIESIYSGGATRSYDAYNQGTHNSSFSAAAAVPVDPGTLTAQLTSLDITTPGMAEFFKFVAPAGSTSLHLGIQSDGLSLLAPRVWIYNSAETLLAYKSAAGDYGATLNLGLSSLRAGATYYIKVAGADNTALGTGLYDLSMSTGANAVPSVTLPNTLTPNGSAITNGGCMAEADGDATEANAAPESVTAQLPSAPATVSLGVLELDGKSVLGEQQWVLHHAQPATADPHARALADHLTRNDSTQDTTLDEELAAYGVRPPFSRN